MSTTSTSTDGAAPFGGGDRGYYLTGGVEVIAAIEAWELNFSRGNVVKYVARAGRKAQADELDDLRKALTYLQREIERVEKERPESEPPVPSQGISALDNPYGPCDCTSCVR